MSAPGVAEIGLRRDGGPAFRCDAVVLFGITGDLAFKKLFPALYNLAKDRRLDMPVIGVGRSKWDDTRLMDRARDSIKAQLGTVEREPFEALARSMSYLSGDYNEPETFEHIRAKLSGAQHPLFYLAIPPSVFESVVCCLKDTGLNDGSRVVIEKPFGRDLATAKELNTVLHSAFAEEQIYRID